MRIEVTQCSMCKHYSEEQYCEIWQQYITNDAFYCACGVKADRKTENSSEKPNNCEPKICDFCRYYNSNIPCGSTPSACKEADKFAKEFVDGLKKLKPKTEPQTDCKVCLYRNIPKDSPHCMSCKNNSKFERDWSAEPQTDCAWGKGE